MDDKAARIKSALETAPAKYPLRRHRDDDYVDEVRIAANGVHLHAHIVPRFKTSGLSGDEWRISAVLDVYKDSSVKPIFSRSFHKMRGLFEYAPKFLYVECRDVLNSRSASLIVRRKGITLFQQWFSTFGEAAIGLGWNVTIASEGGTPDITWHHLSDDEEHARCQQVGCADPPVNLYQLKQIDEGKHGGHMVTPKYDFVGQFVWYCARHTRRGDCGLEDADTNLVLIESAGVAREHVADESPSAFGGAINVKLPALK